MCHLVKIFILQLYISQLIFEYLNRVCTGYYVDVYIYLKWRSNYLIYVCVSTYKKKRVRIYRTWYRFMVASPCSYNYQSPSFQLVGQVVVMINALDQMTPSMYMFLFHLFLIIQNMTYHKIVIYTYPNPNWPFMRQVSRTRHTSQGTSYGKGIRSEQNELWGIWFSSFEKQKFLREKEKRI